MSVYSAFVLTDESGSVHRVFLVRKEAAGKAAVDNLTELRQWLSSKYAQDLRPVDLEVTDAGHLKDRLKQLNGTTLRKRKR